MEIWDLYDENRQKLNKTMSKSEKRPGGVFNVRVHLCLFNKKGEMLIQQRASNKKHWPNIWCITLSGGVVAGENTNDALRREINEEFGLEKLDLSHERPFFTINTEGSFQDYYLIEKDIKLKDIKFKDGEVQAVKWASKEEILEMIENKQFMQHYPSFIEFVFESRKNRGVLKPEEKLKL